MKNQVSKQDQAAIQWLLSIRWYLGVYNVDFLKFHDLKVTPSTIAAIKEEAKKEDSYWDDWEICVGDAEDFSRADACPSLNETLSVQNGKILASDLYMTAITYLAETFTRDAISSIHGFQLSYLKDGLDK